MSFTGEAILRVRVTASLAVGRRGIFFCSCNDILVKQRPVSVLVFTSEPTFAPGPQAPPPLPQSVSLKMGSGVCAKHVAG